ncbi:MAG: Ktr system potassium transporter B [Methylococcaceae bacterium]|nr:Ktr system potassium transporter B [Methylococcaceae bacterium]
MKPQLYPVIPNNRRVLQRGKFRNNPPAIVAGSFLLLILIGGVILKTPWATTQPISWLAAFFTATSAVTVTGLTVIDTGSSYTLFGQCTLIILMQCGGVGLMTFAIFAILLMGERLSIHQQLVMTEALNQNGLQNVVRIAKEVVIYALVIEAIGMVLLSLCWVPEKGWSHGLFYALFHTVSAFNNAGFGLEPDNIVPYVSHTGVNLTLSGLFIIGGLGFSVLMDLREKRRFQTLRVHSKIMLVGTLVLNLVAMLVFFLLEYGNPTTLGKLPGLWEQLLASWFQAVTPRTAGFNSLDMAALTDGSVLLFMVLMFIGAGPSSTASGIKLSTAVVLLLATRTFLQRQDHVIAFGRTINQESIIKALAVTVCLGGCVFITLLLLTVTEHKPFLDVAFEVFSAYGTVGLSRGLTPQLSQPGQLLIMLSMFLGRIGPLSLGFILATPKKEGISYANTHVQIG